MIGSPGNDESASTKQSRPGRGNQSNSVNQNNDRSDDDEDHERKRQGDSSTTLPLSRLQPPSSSSSPSSSAVIPPPAPSTIQATSSQHDQGQSLDSISPPPPSGTRSRSMSLVPGLDILSPLLFSGIGGGGAGGIGSSGQGSSGMGRKNSSLNERTPQFMTVAPSFTTRNGPWSQQDPLARARKSIDVRSFPSYLARKRQSIIGARLFDTLVEVAGSPLQPITPEGEDNEENRSSTDNNSHKNGDSRGSRKSLVHRLRGNRKSIEEEEPEAPTLSLGERVAWLKTKGPEFGTVRWIGRLPKVSASWTVGVEFDNAIGSTDGKFENRRYFTAKDSFAKFLPLSSLTRVDNIIGRQRSGTLLSRMSVQLKPGQLISVQRESENNLPIHCALNAPHHIDHDVHVPNMNHCLCNNCNHPCAHLCKTKKPKGRKTDMAHMCHFSQKPHNKLCCGGEELLYSLASAQDLELNGSPGGVMGGGGGIGPCSGRRGRGGSNPSGGGGDSTSGNGHGPGPNGCSISSYRRRSGGSRRRSSGSSSTIRKLRDKSRRISSAPTSTERKAESQTTTGGTNKDGDGGNTGNGGGGGGEKDGKDVREEDREIFVGDGEGTSCQEGGTQLNPFPLSKLKSGSELSVSSLPSTGVSQVEVYIARGALTDESDLDDDDEDEYDDDDDGCSSGLVSSQGRPYLRGKRGLLSHHPHHLHHHQQQHPHHPNQLRRRRRRRRRGHHHHHYRRSGTGGSRSITTNTGRSSRSSRRRYSSDTGTQITSGTGGDGCSGPSRRSGKRSGLRSLVSCLVPSIPKSYTKSGKSSKNKKSKGKGSIKGSKRRDEEYDLIDGGHHLHHLGHQVNCDPINYPYYPCSCDGRSSCTPHHPSHHLNESLGELSSTAGHPLVPYSGQESNQGDFGSYPHHHYHPLTHPLLPHPLSSSSSLQKQQQPQNSSADLRHHYYPHPPHHHHHYQHHHQQSLAHSNSTRHSSASSSHHHHHHHHHQPITCSSSSSRRQPQPQQQQQSQHRQHHSQRKHHGLSTSPEPEPSPVNNKNGRSSTLLPHSLPPPLPSTATNIEDNLNFGVRVGLTGRASPCGHFYYSPCPISASQSSIGALQRHLSPTTITTDNKNPTTTTTTTTNNNNNNNNHPPQHHHQHQPSKQPSSPAFEKSINHNQSNHKFPQLKSFSSSSSTQPQSNQCAKLVDLDDNLSIDLKSVQLSSKVNESTENSNFILDLSTFNLNCDSINNKPNEVKSNCLLTSSPPTSTSTPQPLPPPPPLSTIKPSTIKSSSVNHYQSALKLNNTLNHSNCSSNEFNQLIGGNGNCKSTDDTSNSKLNHHHTCNGVNHNSGYESNKLIGSPGGGLIGGRGGGGGGHNQIMNKHSRQHQHQHQHESIQQPPPATPTTSNIVTPTPNGIINGENVLITEPNCSYSNSSTTVKVEVELTRSPSIQSYTSNSMISPRRKRKGPAPPPPVIGTFKPFPGPSGINVSPLTSPSPSPSSSSSPSSSLAVTPTASPSHLPGPSSILSPSNIVTPSPPSSSSSFISSKFSNVVNTLNPGPSTSGCSRNTLTMGMGRKKSIKNKPAPSPPPPLPTLPPLASRPKSVTKGASSSLPRPNTIGANPSSSVVIIHESPSSSPPQKPFTSSSSPSSPSPTINGQCPSPKIVPTSCGNMKTPSPSTSTPSHHLIYRPVSFKCLPCRSHSVPVCPISTLTRSLSDQKQINAKQMLKSVASYSSDLNLPKYTPFNGLISNSPTESSFQHEQTLESDSIIITYDDHPEYCYPINYYSSCEIPYTIRNSENVKTIYPEDDDKMNSRLVTMPTTPMRRRRQKDDKGMSKSQSFTTISSNEGKGSPLGRPPRPPPPSFNVNSNSGYKIINKSIPQIPVRTRRQNRPTSISLTNYCSLDSCCQSDHLSNLKMVSTLPSKSSSLVLVRPRSAPASPSNSRSHHLHGSCSFVRTDSTLTFTQDKTLSEGSGNHQGANGATCSTTCTTCSLCSLGGGTLDQTSIASGVTTDPTTTTTTTRMMDNEPEMMKQKDGNGTMTKDEETIIEEPIYEEIDFGLISENVAALLSPRQLINSVNKSRTWDSKGSKDVNDDDEMMMTVCHNAINVIPIETVKGRRLSSSSGGGGGGGGKGKDDDDEMVKGAGHQTNSEILSDTSDDRVTVKSMTTHTNNNQLKPWAYSSSSLDSEQSTTSSGSTVKQWANQIVSYPSNNHFHHPHPHNHFTNHHPLHHSHHHHHHPHHHHPHHLDHGSSGSSTATSSCYHGNHSTFYRIQGIGHHHLHHPDDDVDEDNQQQQHQQQQPNHHHHLHHHHHHPLDPYHPNLATASASASRQQHHHHHCYHCPHHHQHQHHRHYHHHGHRMITTSTSDHSLSSLSSSNFSEDPTTPTPPNLMNTLHDDYNFTFLPDGLSSSAGHYCPDLDETNEDEDDDQDDEEVDVTVDDEEEEEVMMYDEIVFRGEVKNEFGKSSCCYSDPFYQIPDLHGDEHEDDEDTNEGGGDGGKRKEKETEEDGGKWDNDRTSPATSSDVCLQKIKPPTSSAKLNDLKSVQLSSSPSSSCPSPSPVSLSTTNNTKTRSLSSLNHHHHRVNCEQIAANQSPSHCHQCYHHPHHHLIDSRAHHHHHHLSNQSTTATTKSINHKSGHLGSRESMASSWDDGGPFGGDHNHHNHPQTQNHGESHNDGNNLNRLMQELQLAISYGQHRKAALLARQLALRKVSCSFNQSTVNATGPFDDQPIISYLYIEDKHSRQGPFPIQLFPSMTVKMLKQKIEGDFGFPVNLQSWILGKCLATNEDALLSAYGITLSGCPIFLYLLSNNNKDAGSDQVTINSDKNTLGQSVSTSVLDERSQHDRDEVKSEKHDDDDDGDDDGDELNHDGVGEGMDNTTLISNDTKEEMKSGKRRSITIASKLSSSSSSSTGENINETHADHQEDNEKRDLVGGKSSSGGAGGNGSKSPQPSSSSSTDPNEATISMVKTLRRCKGIKVPPSPSSSSSSTFTSSPTTSKSTQKVPETHGENHHHHYPPPLNQVNDQLIRKADKVPMESPRRMNRTIQSTLKLNDIKMMQTLDNQASGANKPDNDGVNNIIIKKKQEEEEQSNGLMKNQRYQGEDNQSNDHQPGSGNGDNKGNGNKMAEVIGQQVKGDDIDDQKKKKEKEDDDGNGEGDNETGDEDNQDDDGNQAVIESTVVITDTYKQLMALDDVDLVKNFEDFECPVCFINIPSGEGVALRDCLHTFCRECLCNSIEFCDEAIVKCPYRSDEYYCDSAITDREIKSLASEELYQKHLARSMKAAELRIAKSFHCKTADCPGWCEYDDNVNTFPCPVCGKVNCLTCQAIHEGINCRQYQDALEFDAVESNEDAKKTKQFLDNMLDKGEALRCPICFVILIKKWGCDWVKCSMCQSEICWVTKGPRWGPGGKGDTSGGCKCMINGQKCHPKCNYCH